MHASVKVDGNILSATDSLAQMRDTLHGIINFAVAVDNLHLFCEIHLGRLKAIADGLLSTAHDVCRPVTALPMRRLECGRALGRRAVDAPARHGIYP